MERQSPKEESSSRRWTLAVLRFSLAIAVCQACCGCTLLTYGSHILLTDPLHFPNNMDHLKTRHEYRKVAKQYLNDIRCANPDFPMSKEYADGFLDGFADHVTYGPRHAPPALPPRRYWKKEYASPWGYEAIQDWHGGFAEGSLEAARSGLREFQTVPSSFLGSSMAVPIGSEVLPAVLPEPLETINSPADGTAPEMMPPEVHFFPDYHGEQAMPQMHPTSLRPGTVQPAVHVTNMDMWRHLAAPPDWKQDSQDATAPASSTMPSIYLDNRLQFDRLPVVATRDDEPLSFAPLTPKQVP